jgi:ribosomal protein L21
MVVDGDNVQIGQPVVAGAVVAGSMVTVAKNSYHQTQSS